MDASTWEKANTPIRIGIKEMPPIRYVEPNVKRIFPVMASIPIVPIKSPSAPPISPLITEPEDTLVIILMPNSARAKYSALEKVSATFASCGAKTIRQIAENTPPNILPVVESPSARPGCPILFAIG